MTRKTEDTRDSDAPYEDVGENGADENRESGNHLQFQQEFFNERRKEEQSNEHSIVSDAQIEIGDPDDLCFGGTEDGSATLLIDPAKRGNPTCVRADDVAIHERKIDGDEKSDGREKKL